MTNLRFTILGCGSSGGVPRLGGYWGACNPGNPRNRRRRCSLLVQQFGTEGSTTLLIDTSPDLREQLLGVGIGSVDGVLYTHAHADHVNGLDELRVMMLNMKSPVQAWADQFTERQIYKRFRYAVEQLPGSSYRPFIVFNRITNPTVIYGPGGAVTVTPFSVEHGEIQSLGYRIGPLAYLPDVSDIPDKTWPILENLDCWIVDALQLNPHPSHAHLGRTLGWISAVSPRRAILTDMHTALDYDETNAKTPENVEPAYDGMTIEYAI